MEPIIIFGLIVAVIIALAVILAVSWYRIVPPSEAHLVVTMGTRRVYSSDEKISGDGRSAYFKIPSFIPIFGREVRMIDLTTKEIVMVQETYEKNQARYNVRSSTKFRIDNVVTAANTFVSTVELKKQMEEVIASAVRAVTIKYEVQDARAQKKKMEEEVNNEIRDDLAKWGLTLISFQLVDFQDTQDSKIISNISKRREVAIETDTREQNAEKIKQAKIKEAAADEEARKREIDRDRVVGEQEQRKKEMIAIKQKVATEKELEVKKVQVVKSQEIEKDRQIVMANQDKETEAIRKEQKKLQGEGDKLRDMEAAKGLAAPIREKGLAEAEAKMKLQDALNKFGDNAIRALTAELIVQKDKEVGVAAAEALAKADVKAFLGGKDGQSGFDLAQLISSARVADESTAMGVINKIARPNDLGFAGLDNSVKRDKKA